jgi:hypothetical protein
VNQSDREIEIKELKRNLRFCEIVSATDTSKDIDKRGLEKKTILCNKRLSENGH